MIQVNGTAPAAAILWESATSAFPVAAPTPAAKNALPTTGPTSEDLHSDGPEEALSATRATRLVGFSKIRKLLRPLHRYFRDKVGCIKEFQVYKDVHNDLAYPVVQVLHRDNPYRRYQLSHKANARTYKRLKALVERRQLEGFAVASVVITMPTFMSQFLAGRGLKGRDMAWRLFEGFWAADLSSVVGKDIDLASHTNMHVWRTDKPFEPHYHFHTLIPNYGLTKTHVFDKDAQPTMAMARWKWHRLHRGREVPFSDTQLEVLKALWKARLVRFCRRHGLAVVEGNVDIYVEYIDSWQKLLHRFNYNGRHWTENYAEYSQYCPNCPDPPAWLVGYNNRARCKGWWSNLKGIEPEGANEDTPSPYTGQSMNYIGNMGLDGLLNHAGERLGVVEFVRGKLVEGMLSDGEIGWLKEVMPIRDASQGEMEDLDAT